MTFAKKKEPKTGEPAPDSFALWSIRRSLGSAVVLHPYGIAPFTGDAWPLKNLVFTDIRLVVVGILLVPAA